MRVNPFFILSVLLISHYAEAGDQTRCTPITPVSPSYSAAVKQWEAHIQSEKTQTPPVKADQTSFILPDPNSPNYKPPTSGKVVVMVHGLSDSPTTMKDIAQTYVDNGFTVVGVRMSGHGTTLADFRANGTAANWEKDLSSAMAIAKGMGSEISLAGYSTGGAVAINYALKDRINEAKPKNQQDPNIVPIHAINLMAPLVDFADQKQIKKAHYATDAESVLKHVMSSDSLTNVENKYFFGKKNTQWQNLYSYTGTPAEVGDQAERLVQENNSLMAQSTKLAAPATPMPINFILGSADTTISNSAATRFAQKAASYGFNSSEALIQDSNINGVSVPHGLFTMKNLQTTVNPNKTAANLNPVFPQIVESTQQFLAKTGDASPNESATNALAAIGSVNKLSSRHPQETCGVRTSRSRMSVQALAAKIAAVEPTEADNSSSGAATGRASNTH